MLGEETRGPVETDEVQRIRGDSSLLIDWTNSPEVRRLQEVQVDPFYLGNPGGERVSEQTDPLHMDINRRFDGYIPRTAAHVSLV